MRSVWLSCAAALLATAFAVHALHGAAQSPAPRHSSATPEPAGEPAARSRGQVVYRERCEICHFSTSVAQKIGPGLKGLYQRGKLSDGAKVEDAAVQRRILDGYTNMPPFRGILTPVQMRDLLAYLKGI